MGYSHGELTNYSNIARDSGVDAKTVKEYYQILIDTLLGTMIQPYKRRQDRKVIIRAGKFFLFDVGVAGAITQRRIPEERGELFGKAFEHFILMELLAHRAYSEINYDVNFWRTKSGLEVDFILGRGEVAVVVKGANRVDRSNLLPLKTFIRDYRPARAFVVCNESFPRQHGDIHILPWRDFLKMLWKGEVISLRWQSRTVVR